MLTLTECLNDQSEIEESEKDDVEFIEAREDAAEALESKVPRLGDFQEPKHTTKFSLVLTRPRPFSVLVYRLLRRQGTTSESVLKPRPLYEKLRFRMNA